MFNIKRFAEIFNNEKLSARWTKLKKNKHFMYGMPFVILVVGAPHVLYHINTVSNIFNTYTGKLLVKTLLTDRL